jgi:hypothetical protein
MKELYKYIYRTDYCEVIQFIELSDTKIYRLLCYDLTSTREKQILIDFKFLNQTNSVQVMDGDHLEGLSWFSADFIGEENLILILKWAEGEEMQW